MMKETDVAPLLPAVMVAGARLNITALVVALGSTYLGVLIPGRFNRTNALISLLLFVWTFYLPETPHWLIQNGFKAEGLWTLADLDARGDVTDARVNRTYYEIVDAVELEEHNHDLGDPLQGLNGINALLHFLLRLSRTALKRYSTRVSAASFTLPARSPRSFTSTNSADDHFCSSAASLSILCALKLYIERWSDQFSIIGGAHGVVVGMPVYFFFASTWGPVPWLLSAELFPFQMRSKEVITRGGYYVVLVGFCVVCGVLMWLAFVETGDEEDPVLNISRRRARGQSTVSMSSQLMAMNGLGAASQLSLQELARKLAEGSMRLDNLLQQMEPD
ncbi:hypothetical protein B0H12DRAFT_1227285 [Mycena haematopus]|nr:hypothetical protein B0H12DRAFT_1227285 [Mycena haematopus]